jgi:hypothetical protein
LESAIPIVRERAEGAAEALLNTYAVNRADPYPGMTEAQRRMRNGLRARARQLGNGVMNEGLEPLKSEIAYEQWHRMVFARFLAENGLLRHPSGVAVTLQDCAELATEEGEADAWAVASKYASLMLPGIFRPEDPAAQLRLAPEGRNALETILNGFLAAAFTADDSLGWMYQFWQSKKKKEVNESERKIGGADIAPVTQLFTEDYMVRFLLENSLGAWWAGRHPQSPLLKKWAYLRFKEDGTPAAGTFPGWPKIAAEVTLMDPCCGSGHFLVAGFDMLVEMRMEEEGLGEAKAAEAVLRDNIFGLELDPRCTQIAAFALALAAWKRGGYRPLPVPNVACSGIPVQGQLETWLKLAGKDARLRTALERLYQLFSDAPDLGSLINPADLPQNEMFMASYDEVAPVFEQALAKENNADDPVAAIFGIAAEGVAKAARLLAGKYTLVVTNVPYLARGKQDEVLQDFCNENHPIAKTDLATVFVERCLLYCATKGSIALVTPQNWLFLVTYKDLRKTLLNSTQWNVVAKLGENGFESTQAAGAFTALFIISQSRPQPANKIVGIDASIVKTPNEKASVLSKGNITIILQTSQINNPDSRVTLCDIGHVGLLSNYAISLQGISPADFPHYGRKFWEVTLSNKDWNYWQSSVLDIKNYGGREHVLWLCNDFYKAVEVGQAYVRGHKAWNKQGVVVSQMRSLPVTIFTGERFDTNVAIIVPNDPELFPAIWAFCSSPEYTRQVRVIDQKINVTNATLVKVPFDLEYWQKVADAAGP